MILLGVVSIVLFLALVICVIFGVPADNHYHMTGRYPYKLDLWALANVFALMFLVCFAVWMSIFCPK